MSEYEIVNARLWVDVSPDGTDAQIGITCSHGRSRTSVMSIPLILQIGEAEVIAALCGSHRSEDCVCGEKLWENYQRQVAQRYTNPRDDSSEGVHEPEPQKVIDITPSAHIASVGDELPDALPHALPPPSPGEEARSQDESLDG